jgi:hypothetical protein
MPTNLESPAIVGSQKAYEDFLPAAQAIAETDIRPFRADASVAYHNIVAGVEAITPLITRIQSDLPKVDVPALQQLPDIALGVIYAVAQVDRSSDGTTPALLEKARGLRSLLIKSAHALVAANVIPAHSVDRIREGSGPIDLAQDNIDLAALYTKHDADITGKTPVTAAQVVEAATIGTELLKRLKPKGTKSKDSAMDEVIIRDRMWTLLVLRYRELRRVGLWFFMDDVDDHVPALQSRTSSRKKTTPNE